MSHVWAVTFNSAEGVKISSLTDVKVKDRRCLVTCPSNQEARLKLHWLLHNAPELAVYGCVPARCAGSDGVSKASRTRAQRFVR